MLGTPGTSLPVGPHPFAGVYLSRFLVLQLYCGMALSVLMAVVPHQ